MAMFRSLAFALIALACATATVVRADDVAVKATIEPGTVEVGGQAVLTVAVEGKFRRTGAPELPPLGDFDVFESGTSQSFSFVNGQAHSSLTFHYVLAPRKEGTFRIEPIRYAVGDKTYTANPVTLAVVAGGAGIAPPSSPAPSGGGANRGATPSSEESIFITASVDRDTVYVNQQVTWSLGYYTDGRVELLRSPNYSPPSAEGFWVEDLPPQNKYYRNLHNRQYLVSEIKRGYFPTAPGTYRIGEARVDIVIDNLNRRGAFDDFFGRGRGGFGEPRTLTTEPVTVVVLPLPPAGKPTDFAGAVASDLTVSIVADKQVVQVGEPINVSIEMNGAGNMRTIASPKLAEMPQFKTYESGSSSDSFKKDYVVSGRRKFDFVVVPQVEGNFTLPAVRVAYFDPELEIYRVAESAALPVEVKPGTQEDGRKVIYAGGGDDFEVINRDIRFIHAVPASLQTAATPFYRTPLFIAMQALPVLLLGASVVVERRQRRLRKDVVFARASRALREAGKRLGDAERAFGSGNAQDGFGRVHAALFGFFSDKMNAPVAGLTSDDIERYLRESKVGEDVIASVRAVIDACDAARYAAAGADPVPAVVARARDAMVAIEKAVR